MAIFRGIIYGCLVASIKIPHLFQCIDAIGREEDGFSGFLAAAILPDCGGDKKVCPAGGHKFWGIHGELPWLMPLRMGQDACHGIGHVLGVLTENLQSQFHLLRLIGCSLFEHLPRSTHRHVLCKGQGGFRKMCTVLLRILPHRPKTAKEKQADEKKCQEYHGQKHEQHTSVNIHFPCFHQCQPLHFATCTDRPPRLHDGLSAILSQRDRTLAFFP